MKDRITVLFPITDLEMHGAQHQLLELAKGLDKECFRPIILTFGPGGPLEQEIRDLANIQLISLKRKGKYDFLCLFTISRIIRKMKVDVIQPFLTPATFFSLLPAIICRTPVKIVTERSGPGRTNTNLGYRLYLKAEDFLSQFADWAVANSQAGREYLIERGIKPSRTMVIYNGIEPSRLTCDSRVVQEIKQRLNLQHNGKVVGMIARMYPDKHHDDFLKAAAIINRAIPETKFLLLGDGPLRCHLENLSHELGLSSRVFFLGEQKDVIPYLSILDIVALSSETEGLSLSICEAMTLRKPVVVTDVGGNRELVEDGSTGFLVPPRDNQALAKAIIRLIKDQDLAQIMGERAGKKIAQQLGMERYVNEYQSLYKETLKRKRKRYCITREAH
jgi:glycosyltransferase involved in cell wall biosynthesis